MKRYSNRKEMTNMDLDTELMDQQSCRFQQVGGRDKKALVLQLVPGFSGDGDLSEWLEKVETTCMLNDVTSDQDVLYVITLRLAGEAYRVVQQLDADVRAVKEDVIAALRAAYEVNVHDAYELFRARRWREGESVDGYLASLRKLAKLCGGASDRLLMAAFVSGLPERVKVLMRSSVGADHLMLAAAVAQARQIINKMSSNVAEKCLAASGERREQPRCYGCGKQGHLRYRCPEAKCFKCQKKGHLQATCPGNVKSE